MLVFWKQSLVVLAVPKTGTTALEAALSPHADMVMRGPPALKHSHVYRFNRFLRPMFDRIEQRRWEFAAVVRDPVDWIGSWYRYRSRPALRGTERSTQGVSFDDFTRAYLSRPAPKFADLGSQSWIVDDGSGQSGVDHLFAYEHHDRFLAFLEDRLGRDIALARMNTSPAASLSLDPALVERLKAERPADFALHAKALKRGN